MWAQPSKVTLQDVLNITVSDVLQALLEQTLCFCLHKVQNHSRWHMFYLRVE